MEKKDDKMILDRLNGITQNGFGGLKSGIENEISELKSGIEKKFDFFSDDEWDESSEGLED